MAEILLATTVITVLFLVLPLRMAFATSFFCVVFWLLTFSSLALSRVFAHQILRYARSQGRNLRSIVVVGEGADAARLGDRIENDSSLGYRLVRIIDAELFKAPEVGVMDQLNLIVAHHPIDEVLVALSINKYASVVETVVHQCEEQGIIVRVRAEIFNLNIAKSYADNLHGVPVLTIQSGPEDSWCLVAKRLLDIVVSAGLLILLSPLFLIVAVIIRLESPGPVFFSQDRVGYNKRRFKILKFRTMLEGSDYLQHLYENMNEAEGPVFKIKNDPRITRVGKFLRRSSIDELPQLINVLNGEMSLVGPRPLPVRDVDRIEERWHKRRFSIKPGITCLWQVNGRSNTGFDEWVRLDLEYIDSWSLGLDLKILMLTIPAVFRGPGAY